MPPGLEACFSRRCRGSEGQARVAEHDGIERPQNLSAMRRGPGYRVDMLEVTVLGIRTIDRKTRYERTRSQVTPRRDVVACEDHNRRGRHGAVLGFTENAIGVGLRGQRFLDRGTT